MLAGSGLTFDVLGSDGAVVTQDAGVESDGPIVLNEVLVSGERVERTVFETASSVFVVSGDELERNTVVEDVQSALTFVPNLSDVGQESGAPAIRGAATTGPLVGVAGFVGGTLPRATVVVDGRPITNFEYTAGSTSIYDVERIEVFRGPQTTSQGVNSIAGAVQVVTADPTFDFQARGLAAYGNNDTARVAGAVSGPLLEDELAGRFTFDYKRRDSFVDFSETMPGLGFEPDEFEQLTLRGKLLWEPSAVDGLSTKLTLSLSDSREPERTRVAEPFGDLVAADPNGGIFDNRALTAIHDLTYEISDNLIFSNRFSYTNFDGERIDQPGFGNANIEQDDFFEEGRLSFAFLGDRLTGFVGASYRRITEDSEIDIGPSTFEDTRESFGIFGEVTYAVTERFDVTAGLRYQSDSQDRSGAIVGLPLVFDETFDQFLPRFSVGYDVTNNLRVGALVSRGFSPGGATVSLTTGAVDTFDEETVLNFEAFARGSFFDDRLSLQVNVFYSEYDDYQLASTIGFDASGQPITDIENAERVESYGLEVTAEAQPTDRLSAYAGLGLLRTRIDEFSSEADQSIVGNRLPLAPTATFSLGVDYEIVDNLTVGGRLRYSSAFFNDKENTSAFQSDEYVLADLNASYRYGGVEAYAYINNVTDNIVAFDPLDFGDGATTTVARPREIGVGLRVEF